MLNKRNLPIVLIVFFLGLAIAIKTFAFGTKPPATKYERILRNLSELLQDYHYSPKPIDDKFSQEVFTKYLADVDVEKRGFLQSDIQELSKYKSQLDDEMLGKAPVEFVPAVRVITQKRLAQTQQITHEILSKPFDFSKDETVNLNYEKLDYPANEVAQREMIRKKLKYLTLEKYADLLEQQQAAKTKAGFVSKTNEQIEKEARDKVLKITDRYYDHLKLKANEDDLFNLFVETIVQCMDPHTDYFPPVEKRSFDEDMSGRFYGIGAALRDEDGTIKIVTLVTGSPAWKSGQITVGDIILKVGQGNAEPVDLTSYMVEDAVKIIRGTKGSEVKLTLKKADGSVKTVTLIRDEIVQDEKFAKSVIIQSEKGKIGYIFFLNSTLISKIQKETDVQ